MSLDLTDLNFQYKLMERVREVVLTFNKLIKLGTDAVTLLNILYEPKALIFSIVMYCTTHT